jgi:D-3-phosphoglycerate dehydrogenase / 2-oxoglutarate reductase
MYKIAIIEEFHKSGLNLFDKNKNFSYEIINDTTEENLIKKLPYFDGCTLRVTKLNSKILRNCPKLKVISRHGVGYDNVDIDYLKKENISLLITSNANAIAVAEHVMYMMLSISKGIITHDLSVRNGSFKKGIKNIQTLELDNKEILIVGFGRIGKSLISKCRSFNMKINIYDPFVDENIIKNLGCQKVTNLNNGFKTADYITLHVPLNKNTENLINLESMKIMKKNTIIINTARGGIINEKDLDQAIREGIIFGAGIDVFKNEPVGNDNPLVLNNRVLLSPHSATFTDECKLRMAKQTVQNVIDFFEGKIDSSMKVNL